MNKRGTPRGDVIQGGGGYRRVMSAEQRETLVRDLSYDDGGRYSLLAVTGYEIRFDDGLDRFGTIFSIIDTISGDEIETSQLVRIRDLQRERQNWIERVTHLNGQEDAA